MLKDLKNEWVIFWIGYFLMCILFIRDAGTLGSYSVQYAFYGSAVILIGRWIYKKFVTKKE